MASLKDIKRKIKSVQNTQKTTNAMKLVSVAKLKKAEEAAKKSKLYAPFDCEITDVDEDNHSIVLRKDDVQYWYDGNGGTNRDTEVYFSNANLKSGLKKGDKLKEGEYFADSTGHQYCDEDYDNNLNADYVHIKVKIDTDGYGWDFIDPRLVLY